MNQPYAIMRTTKLTSWGNVAGVGAHNARTRATASARPDGPAPQVLIGSGAAEADLRARYESSGIVKLRKNGVIGIEVLLGASPDYFRSDAPGRHGYYHESKVNDYNQLAVEWLKETFGENNVVSAICHKDESTPHIHAVIAPIDSSPLPSGRVRTRQNAKRWLGGKGKLSALQTSFASKMKPLGLIRGVKGSKAEHQTVRQYYSSLRSDPAPLPDPTIDVPPPIISSAKREKWAKDQADKIKKQQKEAADRLAVQAAQAVSANRRARAMSRSASQSADRLRDLPLVTVAADLELEQDRHDKHMWRGPSMAININDSKYFDHKQNKGGGGAIDLVMHCMDCDFRQALVWLADRYGDQAAASSVASSARNYVKKAKSTRKPYAPPSPSNDPADWQAVRDYLIDERALAPDLVDFYHDNEVLYASKYKGHVNAVFLSSMGNCAEIQGIAGRKYKGLAPGSKPTQGGFRVIRNSSKSQQKDLPLVLVESSIEALSFAEICDYDCEIISTCGCKPDAEFIHLAILQNRRVIVGYNNDDAGKKAYNDLFNNYKNINSSVKKSFPPKNINDWNDFLLYNKGKISSYEAVKSKTEENIKNIMRLIG